jgi:hypothetical protein
LLEKNGDIGHWKYRRRIMADDEDNLIERITENRQPHFEPYGWHHWPEHPWLAYQFRRGLGETQEGGGTVSECFQAASRMIPGDKESWHREWMRVADRNESRGRSEQGAGHIRTAMNCYLRAADYYRQAEFHLKPDDPSPSADIHQDGIVQPSLSWAAQPAGADPGNPL